MILRKSKHLELCKTVNYLELQNCLFRDVFVLLQLGLYLSLMFPMCDEIHQ